MIKFIVSFSLVQSQPCSDLFSLMIGRLPSPWQQTFFIKWRLFLSSSSNHFSFHIQFFCGPPRALPQDVIWQEIFCVEIRGRGRRHRPASSAYINLLAIWHLPILWAAGSGGAESAGSHYHWWWSFDEVWQRRSAADKNNNVSLQKVGFYLRSHRRVWNIPHLKTEENCKWKDKV